MLGDDQASSLRFGVWMCVEDAAPSTAVVAPGDRLMTGESSLGEQRISAARVYSSPVADG